MSDPERSPLLGVEDGERDRRVEPGNESTPLLSSSDTLGYDGIDHGQQDRGDGASKAPRRRWPSIIAMILLGILSIAIIVVAFVVPAAIEEYAKEAAVLEPTNLSLESITTDGVRARIQANFRLDGSKVKSDHVRRVGSVATWFVRELGTEATSVNVYLPEYDNIMLGSANIPPINLKINGQNTAIDMVADLVPGQAEGIRTLANEWLEGRMNRVRFLGKADIQLKTGIIPLGTHTVSESLTFEGGGLPPYNITKVFFRDIDNHTVGAEVSINAFNKWPVELDIPPLAFEILVPNCGLHDPYILVAEALTDPVDIRPRSRVVANVHGVVRELPDSLTRVCPDSENTPLDRILKQYLGGQTPNVFVRGKSHPAVGTPEWLNEIMSQVVVPVPFPGRSFDNLIRKFSLTDTHFSLPDPLAEPDDPGASPKVSGTIQVLAGLPKEMNFGINVTHIRAAADVFFQDQKLGVLDVRKWQPANSTRIESGSDGGPELEIQSRIDNAPLNVTDGDVLTDVIQRLIFQGKTIQLDIKASVDVQVETVLGDLVLKDIPAEGRIPVKLIRKGGPSNGNPFDQLAPRVGNIKILETTPESLRLEALVNVTNPTSYTASIPYVTAHILCNGSVIGEITAENLDIQTGHNPFLVAQARWQPSMGGESGKVIARELLSQYLSGFNTTLSVRAHRNSIPGQPLIGEALSHFNITIPTPHLALPGDDDDDNDDPDAKPDRRTHFIREATFHLLSSSAQFTLASPLRYNTIYLEHINATAYYNHTEPVGRIIHDLPFAAKPGLSQTPKLPVDWSVGSIGRDKVRKALGGELKLDAVATVGVRIGEWRERVWFIGRGIGAHIRL
ncbi:hypothetical protein M406DRAFT_97430 [Cryphonectria parasitica EP155]|uniref:Pre-rRNA processing protein n=1 Tax=Cryphonectria parasitica (strain ATCC 38755 / EP155) TaxID=660469 RepID=A0A9P5CP07_CRYP1|nr:uncharacterized protein M406DRAFT_97430 [Cryphonectria parasitica EP155]KAF3766009.1 hypothetical protein M406DRAFT_97430 [Cryphonectria parasitica EP155]